MKMLSYCSRFIWGHDIFFWSVWEVCRGASPSSNEIHRFSPRSTFCDNSLVLLDCHPRVRLHWGVLCSPPNAQGLPGLPKCRRDQKLIYTLQDVLNHSLAALNHRYTVVLNRGTWALPLSCSTDPWFLTKIVINHFPLFCWSSINLHIAVKFTLLAPPDRIIFSCWLVRHRTSWDPLLWCWHGCIVGMTNPINR